MTQYSGRNTSLRSSFWLLTCILLSCSSQISFAQAGPDESAIVSDEYQVYYFDDIPRLMCLISNATPTEYIADSKLSELASGALYKLQTSLQDLAEKRGMQNDVRGAYQEALNAQEEAEKENYLSVSATFRKQAEAKALVSTLRRKQIIASNSLALADRRVDEAKTSLASAAEHLDSVETDLANTPKDDPSYPGKQKCEETARRLKIAAERYKAARENEQRSVKSECEIIAIELNEAETFNTEAKDAHESAKAKLASDSSTTIGLGSFTASIASSARNAEAEVQRAANHALTAAQLDNVAFANRRDKSPLYLCSPTPSSADPLQRVKMIGVPDEKRIYLRGSSVDVRAVLATLRKFDVARAQTQMTLWTLEISADATKKGSRSTMNALQLIDEELAIAREQTASVLSLLRKCLITEIERVCVEYQKSHFRNVRMSQSDLAVAAFYDSRVLSEFGWEASSPNLLKDARFLRERLPNPERLTTLGEVLVVLSLAKKGSRDRIWGEFQKSIKSVINDAATEICANPSRKHKEVLTSFPNLRRFFETGALGLQMEIVAYLNFKTRWSLIIKAKLDEVKSLQIKADSLTEKYKKNKKNRALGEELAKMRAHLQDIKDDPIFGLEVERQRGSNSARVAALNEMLKQAILSVDGDIQHQFVTPMFYRLHGRLAADRKVRVGVVQRSTILGMNRLVARMGPRASANVAIGDHFDALRESAQFAQLIVATKTGGTASVLGDLGQLQKSVPPEVYGLTTGNVFQVNPVVDPSGQALRFRFDHVLSTQIREPNDTVNLQLPRIEQHSVNTEVQLSNEEIRIISQFNSNAKVGLPIRRSGGIPILKHVPILSELPLIGWFTQDKGQAAVVQQSLILAQTTIIPTIDDIMELLSQEQTYDSGGIQ